MLYRDVREVTPNVGGWLDLRLEPPVIERLFYYIKTPLNKFNQHLAGNITESNIIVDKDNWFFDNVLTPLINHYDKKYKKFYQTPVRTTEEHLYLLEKFWVNYQKKHEFNPVHGHKGVFSFVVWLKIPTDYREEHKLKFASHSNMASASNFSFSYSDMLGVINTYAYNLDKNSEGRMLFFPSHLQHQVYPFFTSNKSRISVSGNITYDSRRFKNVV